MRRSLVVAIVSVSVVIIAVLVAGVLYWVKSYSGSSWEVHSTIAKIKGAELAPPPEAVTDLEPRALVPKVSSGPGLTTSAATQLWAPVENAAREGNWQAWATVLDADTGEVILDEGAGKTHTPASTTKILTARTALDALDFNDRLKTSAEYADGTLYLRGEGDLLLSADAGDTSSVNGYAGLSDLADQVAGNLSEKGVTSVQLAYRDAFFAGEKRAPVWRSQEIEDYAGNVGAYAINAGANPTGETQFVADSARDVAERFKQLLNARGIDVSGINAVFEDPAGGVEVGAVKSATVGQQIEYLLHHSDNTLAEQYCHLSVGRGATFDAAAANVISHVASLGVDTTGMELDDCSGLSENNKISGDQLIDVLRSSVDDDTASASLIRLLPRAGLNGTIGGRLNDFTGNIQAKTGSLASVSTMAGVMTTASGQNLLFAVGADKVPEMGGWVTREDIDTFLSGLANS